MPYTPGEFNYPLIPFDAQDMSSETADIFSMRDSQIQDYLRTETSAIKAETDSLTSTIAGKLDSSRFRFGTDILALPAVGAAVFVDFTPIYPSGTTNIFVVLVNGDYAANQPVLAAGVPDRFGFNAYRVSGGTTGNNFRVNYIAFTL